ncbi:hypothetical protein ACW9IO_23920 [Pseudomonas azotoformans]
MATTQQLWMFKNPAWAMRTSSPAIAIIDAADAASQADGHAEPLLQGGTQSSGFPEFHGQTPTMIGLLKKPLRSPTPVSQKRQA